MTYFSLMELIFHAKTSFFFSTIPLHVQNSIIMKICIVDQCVSTNIWKRKGKFSQSKVLSQEIKDLPTKFCVSIDFAGILIKASCTIIDSLEHLHLYAN